MVAPFNTRLLFVFLGLAAASNPCQSENGTVSDSCLDEAASFLQVRAHGGSSRGTNWTRVSPSIKKKKVSTINQFNCLKWNKPIQVMMTEPDAYDVKQLNLDTGKYTEIYRIPLQRDGWKFIRLNACGINPVDLLLYCDMLLEGDHNYYLVRLDEQAVEFVAKLPFSDKVIANSAGFSPTGIYFVGESRGYLFVMKDVDDLIGYYAEARSSCVDLSGKQLTRPATFFRSDDIVVATVDLLGNGPEEYLFILGQAELQVAQYDYATEQFTHTWKMPIEPYRWDRFYGAGWNFNNQVYFADNGGRGVYQVPLDLLKLVMLAEKLGGYLPRIKLKMKKVGLSEKTTSNDGMNCMEVPSPFITDVTPFDCATHPKPLQALMRDAHYEVASLDYQTGEYIKIYDIPFDRTSPPFQALNAFGVSPLDSIVYACLVIDDWNETASLPPPFYIVRMDSQVIEFVAKVQAAAGAPIAGTFDQEGNYYVISNPTLFKFAEVENMIGYKTHDARRLPEFNMDSSAVAIENLKGINQIADLVAMSGNFDGQGNATWVLGTNAYLQMVAVKVTPDGASYFGIDTTDALETPMAHRLNFGSAWNFDGTYYVSANTGEGVFQVMIDKLQVPDGPAVELKKVGKADLINFNDGFNCAHTSSPFSGNASYINPFGKQQAL